jgi:hypothetical protein
MDGRFGQAAQEPQPGCGHMLEWLSGRPTCAPVARTLPESRTASRGSFNLGDADATLMDSQAVRNDQQQPRDSLKSRTGVALSGAMGQEPLSGRSEWGGSVSSQSRRSGKQRLEHDRSSCRCEKRSVSDRRLCTAKTAQ